uniref:Putative secreted mucin n=1 Tax=Amblyomma cajennense TaxID=34607 RepID=A0A023FDR8_AMBCJ
MCLAIAGRVLCPCTVVCTSESTGTAIAAPPTPECAVTSTDPLPSDCTVTTISAPAASLSNSEEDGDHDCVPADKIHLCAEEADQCCVELYSSVEEGTRPRKRSAR